MTTAIVEKAKAKRLLKAAIVEVFEERAANLAEISSLKKLRSGGGYYRLRIGDYRIGLMRARQGRDLCAVSPSKGDLLILPLARWLGR